MQSTGFLDGSTPVFVLITPLPNWKGSEQSVTEGICIRRLLPGERVAMELSHPLLSYHDVDGSARDGYWICYEFENPYPADNVRYRRRREAAFKLMLHAAYSVQILAPIGGPNLFLLYRRADSGVTLDCTQHRPAFLAPMWGRVCAIPASFQEEIPIVLERVREVFQKPVLRLQIPVWLLEQGLGAPDRHIRILLWATGLDGITRSGGMAAFAERLCQLLGASTAIFPPDATGRRPEYQVIDVAEDLYQLRNEMAHGLPFHEKFRKKRGFLVAAGEPPSEDFASYRYDHVLEECAVFLLCQSLRATFLEGRPRGSAT